jgi:DNA-binding response OmpR family regulator
MDTTKKKILLVEDDIALAAVYRSRLELEDFETKEVHNGEEALAAAKEYQPDLVLLDAMMPKISGFDVLDILRNTPETANMKVIMLTALSQAKDKERAEELGASDYLVKSQVVIGDVVERVKHHLGMGSAASSATPAPQPEQAPSDQTPPAPVA